MMEICESKLYLENLEEEILQRHNVITYKWLMKTEKVTSNVAKQMLYEFLEKQKADGVDLHATYLVSGQRMCGKNSIVHEICIVPASRLDSVKAKFSMITSVHIYALHKNPIQDHSFLYATDYYKNGNAMEDIKKSCVIQYEAVIFRNAESVDDSLSVSQGGSFTSPEEQCQKTTCKQQAFLPKSKNSNLKKKGNIEGSLTSMFNNMEKRRNKVNKSSVVKVQNEKDCSTSISVKKEDIMQSSLTVISSSDNKSPPNCMTNPVQIIGKLMPEKNKTLKLNAANNASLKKRRRIIEISESSSEDEETLGPVPSPLTHPSEVHSDDSEEPLPSKKQSEVVVKGTSRKRKLVDEISKDEDDYLVTEKVWKEVSASEDSSADENENPIPSAMPSLSSKCIKSTANSTKTLTTKNKQATLTNFFKRK